MYSMILSIAHLPPTPPVRYEFSIADQRASCVPSPGSQAVMEINWDFTRQGPVTIKATAVTAGSRPSCVSGLVKMFETHNTQMLEQFVSLGMLAYDGTQKTLEFGDLVLNIVCQLHLDHMNSELVPSAPPLGPSAAEKPSAEVLSPEYVSPRGSSSLEHFELFEPKGADLVLALGTDVHTLDVTSMTDDELVRRLMNDESIPGWDLKQDTQVSLVYLKVFFNPRTMDYHPNTTWFFQWPADVRAMMDELNTQLVQLKSSSSFKAFAVETRFNIQMIHNWIQHGIKGELMHGPLLGWAKMKGHDLYMAKQDGLTFCMARVPGLSFEEYPFGDHGLDICIAIKHLLVQGGFWMGTSQRLPVCAQLPEQSTYDLNLALLVKEFGPMWQDNLNKEDFSMPSASGVSVLRCAPEGTKLLIKDMDLLKNNRIHFSRDVVPNGIQSLFHGPSPGMTWLLQGKAQWCWVLRRQAGGEVSMTWVRGGRRQTQDAAFQVDNIMDVAGGVSMAGLGIYTYHHQLTVEEGGLEKVIYLHLREPPAFKNKVDVFVLKEVTAHMESSLEYGAPTDSPFVPRKGLPGWVCQGRAFDWKHARSYIGWVWQEANNGAITFYYVTKNDMVVEIKQWAKGEPCYEMKTDGQALRIGVEVPCNTWMHADVQTWGARFFES